MTDQTTPVELVFAPVTVDAFVSKGGHKGRPRSEAQRAIDAYVADMYGNGPAGLECDGDEPTVAKLERSIRSAAQLSGYGVKFGAYAKGSAKGKVVVTFLIGEKQTRKPRTPKA